MSDSRANPVLVVCRNAAHVKRMQRGQVRRMTSGNVRFADSGSLRELSSLAPRVVLVSDGVDLDRDVGGEGSLRSILHQRQRTWGDEAVFVDLNAF